MRIQHHQHRKMNKYETKREHERQMEKILHGEGQYIFRNRTGADLTLPKPLANGRKIMRPNEEWQGDNYYMQLVPQEAILVRTIMSPQEERNNLMEQKLILDQPEKVTSHGTVEHVATSEMQNLTETPDVSPKEDMLLVEDPMEGVQILRN